jgi:hypothetical protein
MTSKTRFISPYCKKAIKTIEIKIPFLGVYYLRIMKRVVNPVFRRMATKAIKTGKFGQMYGFKIIETKSAKVNG